MTCAHDGASDPNSTAASVNHSNAKARAVENPWQKILCRELAVMVTDKLWNKLSAGVSYCRDYQRERTACLVRALPLEP